MFNIKYAGELLTDNSGFPRDFYTQTEVAQYLDRYQVESAYIEVIDIGIFEFELPGNVINRCEFGYLSKVQAMARKLRRYRQLQMSFEHLGKWGAYRNSQDIVVELFEEHYEPYSFSWSAYYRGTRERVMNGGLILHKPEGLFLKDGSLNEALLPLNTQYGWGSHS